MYAVILAAVWYGASGQAELNQNSRLERTETDLKALVKTVNQIAEMQRLDDAFRTSTEQFDQQDGAKLQIALLQAFDTKIDYKIDRAVKVNTERMERIESKLDRLIESRN